MILDTTHYEKEHKELLKDIVGSPFGFLQAIRLKGIGSKRLIVKEVSPNMAQYLNKVSDINYANIELRPKGILIHITKGLKNFTWAIPYYQLVLYKIDGSSIHAQGKYIHFSKNKTFRENKPFFRKLLRAKVEHDSIYNFQNQEIVEIN